MRQKLIESRSRSTPSTLRRLKRSQSVTDIYLPRCWSSTCEPLHLALRVFKHWIEDSMGHVELVYDQPETEH